MSEVPSSAVIACIAIIITALLITSVYVLSTSMTDSANTMAGQMDEDVVQEWQEYYQKYDGEEITGGNLLGLIKDSYNRDDNFPILLETGSKTIDFSLGKETPASRLNTAKSEIDKDTIYKGDGVYAKDGTLRQMIFSPVTVN